jgi:hypothetical protein
MSRLSDENVVPPAGNILEAQLRLANSRLFPAFDRIEDRFESQLGFGRSGGIVANPGGQSTKLMYPAFGEQR